MKRTVSGSISASPFSIVEFELCDRYLHSLSTEKVETVVDEAGNFQVQLEHNKKNQCWTMLLEKKSIPLFIYQGEGELELLDALAYSTYPSLLPHEMNLSIINFSFLLNRYLKGEPIVSNEEQRILCDYFSLREKSGDNRICEIDKGLLNA